MKLIIFVTAFVLSMVALISYASGKAQAHSNSCEQLGGVLVRTKGYGSHCIDSSVFIDMTGGE